MNHSEQIRQNTLAWSTGVYDARCAMSGHPEEVAQEMVADPKHFLRKFYTELGGLKGKRVLNLLGSCARKAIPMALLGAEVTVVDVSEDNRRYALETAEAAHAEIDFYLTDAHTFLEEDTQDYDLCLMEGGVLHYFDALLPLFSGIQHSLRSGGSYVLHEFHPFRKLRLPG